MARAKKKLAKAIKWQECKTQTLLEEAYRQRKPALPKRKFLTEMGAFYCDGTAWQVWIDECGKAMFSAADQQHDKLLAVWQQLLVDFRRPLPRIK